MVVCLTGGDCKASGATLAMGEDGGGGRSRKEDRGRWVRAKGTSGV